jgi:hypothetical protein
MAPYQSNGSLTTDKRTINDEDGWETQAEWEAYQSASGVEIVNGAVQLTELTQPDIGISRWTFNDADTQAGEAVDIWDGNNNAVINGGVTTGVAGASQTYSTAQAYDLNGTDGHLDAGGLFTTAPFVFAGWVNFDSTGRQAILDQQELWTIWFDRNGNQEIQIATYGGSQDVSNALQTGVWYHIYCYWDPGGNEVGFSLDGEAVSTFSLGDGIDSTTGGCWFGLELNKSQYALDGTIDDFRTYSTTLTDTEVSDLYTNGSIL